MARQRQRPLNLIDLPTISTEEAGAIFGWLATNMKLRQDNMARKWVLATEACKILDISKSTLYRGVK